MNTVLFDIGDVLVNFSRERLAGRMAENSDLPPDEVRQIWQALEEEELTAVESGQMGGAEHFNRLAALKVYMERVHVFTS